MLDALAVVQQAKEKEKSGGKPVKNPVGLFCAALKGEWKPNAKSSDKEKGPQEKAPDAFLEWFEPLRQESWLIASESRTDGVYDHITRTVLSYEAVL